MLKSSKKKHTFMNKEAVAKNQEAKNNIESVTSVSENTSNHVHA